MNEVEETDPLWKWEPAKPSKFIVTNMVPGMEIQTDARAFPLYDVQRLSKAEFQGQRIVNHRRKYCTKQVVFFKP